VDNYVVRFKLCLILCITSNRSCKYNKLFCNNRIILCRLLDILAFDLKRKHFNAPRKGFNGYHRAIDDDKSGFNSNHRAINDDHKAIDANHASFN
jgi:hypothetical protein